MRRHPKVFGFPVITLSLSLSLSWFNLIWAVVCVEYGLRRKTSDGSVAFGRIETSLKARQFEGKG
jgi:hypothetical protein